jgi:Kef-type K+ transport system membrane component KefB
MVFELIFDILVVLAAAVLVGELFEQFGLPAVAGELLSGLILGPTVAGIVTYTSQMEAASTISLFFIIFSIGFEMNTEMLGRHMGKAVLVVGTSFVFPVLVALAVANLLLPFGMYEKIALVLAIAVPSISIISVLVMRGNLLEKQSGQLILASVTAVDMLAFVLLASLTRSIENTFATIVYTAIFVMAIIILDWSIRKKPNMFREILENAAKQFKREDMPFATLLVVGLFVSALFQLIGISYIVGAFFAGLIFHEGLVGRKAFRKVSETFSKMNNGFFIPLFFGVAGVETFFSLAETKFILAISSLLLSTLATSYFFTRFALKKTNWLEEKDAAVVAATMCGRGAVGIAIASIAKASGLMGESAFAIVIIGTLISSLVTSVLLRR